MKLNEDDFIQIQSRSLSDPPLYDIDFKDKMAWVWTSLKRLFSRWSLNNLSGLVETTENKNSGSEILLATKPLKLVSLVVLAAVHNE